MTDKETVSIVMATYNGAKYIRQQMASILAQTYPLYEIIIQDDGSTDGTIEIIKEYSERYANVHFYGRFY
ncbi:MAG: glycosyltransferase [Prevotella sp.]|nr:glycosyltransferase [Prevotella sp.]